MEVRDSANTRDIHGYRLGVENIAAELYSSPSTSAWGKLGTLLPSMAAFPRWSRMPSLPQRWAMASPSSCPVCTAKLPHLPLRAWMPATQGLCHQGEEGDPLLPTVLFSSPELAVMGKVEGMTGLRGCPHLAARTSPLCLAQVLHSLPCQRRHLSRHCACSGNTSFKKNVFFRALPE